MFDSYDEQEEEEAFDASIGVYNDYIEQLRHTAWREGYAAGDEDGYRRGIQEGIRRAKKES